MEEYQRDELDSSNQLMVSEVRKLTAEIKAVLLKILLHYGVTNFQNVQGPHLYPILNILPGQNSPKNIMNILNDDCLKAILMKIEDVYDFGNAALVCKRLMQNAIECFTFRHLIFRYKRNSHCSERQKDEVFFDDADTFLSIFGHRIRSIRIYDNYKHMYTDAMHKENINLVAQHCGKTLTELSLMANGVINLPVPMQAVKRLCSNYITFQNFALTFPELEVFYVCVGEDVNNFDWITNHFSKLRICSIDARLCTSDVLIEFQNLNPQLETLTIYANEFDIIDMGWYW